MDSVVYEMRSPRADVAFERFSPARRLLRRVLVNPLANYAPAGVFKALLHLGKSELAAANWANPGDWKSMVISYNSHCRQIADRILVSAGAMPMALRNRKRLASLIIADLLERSGSPSPHVLSLGGGPGWIIMDALSQAPPAAHATLVDLSAEAIAFGRRMAEQRGMLDRARFVQADAHDLRQHLHEPCDLVTMLGLCEYLSDEQIVTIARSAGEIMPAGTGIAFNSLSRRHGTDRFFRRVFGLHMVHRSPEDLCRLMQQAGFGDFAVHPEPLGVYHVIVGRKVANGSVG